MLFDDAKPLQNTAGQNCHFLFMSKGMNSKGAYDDSRRGKHWSFEEHIKGLKAEFKRWPDVGDSSDVDRADELKQTRMKPKSRKGSFC